MGITPFIASMYATNLAYDSAGTMFGVNQARMDLANTATGQESPAEVASLAAQDKALTFAGIQAQTNYLVANAMQEQAQRMRKKDQEQRERMLGNGVVFF